MRKLNKQSLAIENSVETYFCNCYCNCGACSCACSCLLWANNANRDANARASNHNSIFNSTDFGARGGNFGSRP